MTLITTLTLIHETEGSAYYAEIPSQGRCTVLGPVTVQKWALPQPTPTAVRVSIEPYVAEHPAKPDRTSAASLSEHEAESLLKEGAAVTIVKNRTAGIHQPPEWLEQYLGRKGTVLWTTAGGAMVKLDRQATWFPYAELQVEE